ncbi:MAG TPA: Asp-tRNA(Asn)/Glu-tRNA(Gln) amidotransferase subunit GatC [Planctomycetota bacterium]|nr:Asp-tRNA(Asn)/Glu-tRNA(Gln) amidotransferase subunit GatC [Planctomycetota bacterium]
MIDRKEVEHVARLARIAVPAEELDRLAGQLAAIVRYVESIQGLKLDNVAPLSHGGDASDVFRADEPRPGLSREDALKGAPDRTDDHFRVPRVLAEPT